VAGSERPVIVRFVTEGGPSIGKLQPGDQILAVNGEDVKDAPRDHVIQLVRACESQVNLFVCQPMAHCVLPGRKSTLLSAGKRAKLRSRPSRVRFAESVCVNGRQPSHRVKLRKQTNTSILPLFCCCCWRLVVWTQTHPTSRTIGHWHSPTLTNTHIYTHTSLADVSMFYPCTFTALPVRNKFKKIFFASHLLNHVKAKSRNAVCWWR